ncbi:hypothetical protein CYMTET_38688 [Cymbomonas tetramitiformis]|uniref:Reverse transcriptase/retrotransposon-derived protein RNase H-like domain-containing protein n=1 Tax=Cymbomonas tetramitiformis TaxID=36881 RepID=A0AAE0CDR6_9CHLO|nr:hypothetical protein CYMTET_38688 [Cymbomonas tetramitiformis]
MITKNEVEWRWGPEQQWAFEDLKAALVEAPVLALPNVKAAGADGSAPFVMQTDASGVALGGVLMQDGGEGLKVIAYESRQFSAAEQTYHTVSGAGYGVPTRGPGELQVDHPGADPLTEVTADAGGVQVKHSGADLPMEVTACAGGVQADSLSRQVSSPHDSDHLSIEAVLRTYVQEWRQDPENTSAVATSRATPHSALFKGADGVLQNLPWSVLVVHDAPSSRSRPQRIRHQRVPPPVIDTGRAAEVRDARGTATGGEVLEALRSSDYTRDGPLRALREQVQAAIHHSTKHVPIVGEVLWRVSAGHYQLVLGEDSPLREIVFREAHDSLAAAGHTGRDKTLERVLRRFWWENASDDVGAWVSSWPTCQAAKPRSSYPDGLLNPHSIPSRN